MVARVRRQPTGRITAEYGPALVALGIGLVGCGMNGQIHAAGLGRLADQGLARNVVAADPDEPARAAAARNGGFARTAASAAEVVEDPDVEAVLVAAPTRTHPDLVRAVLAAGKPLLCEKPLATSFTEVGSLCAEVAASGLTAQVGFQSRFHPLFRRVAALVGDGELGAPMAYVARDDQYWPTGHVVAGHTSWRSQRAEAGGGALLEHSIHSADLLLWLFGPAVRVQAAVGSPFGYDVEDLAGVTVEHASGVVGTLTTVFHGVTDRHERRLEVFGTEGVLEVTADSLLGAPEEGLVVHRNGHPPERPDLDRVRAEDLRSQRAAEGVFFLNEVADAAWIRAVVAGRPASPGFGDALAAHALIDAAYRSAESGAAVAL